MVYATGLILMAAISINGHHPGTLDAFLSYKFVQYSTLNLTW